MKTKPLKLEDLTKDELLRLIRSELPFRVGQRKLIRIRWETISARASRLSGEAIDRMKQLSNNDGWKARIEYQKWSMKFDRAMKLYKKADELWNLTYQKNAS